MNMEQQKKRIVYFASSYVNDYDSWITLMEKKGSTPGPFIRGKRKESFEIL